MMQKTPIISKATINTILCSYCKQKKQWQTNLNTVNI